MGRAASPFAAAVAATANRQMRPRTMSGNHSLYRFLDCHCEKRSDEAIELDHHGALRAPRDDNRLHYTGDWY